MADQNSIENDPTLIGNSRPRGSETSEGERERVRNTNDADQSLERQDITSGDNRGYDEAVRGSGRDVDPDSPEADIDRDDTVTE